MEKLALEIGDQPLELAALVAQGTLRATGTVLMDNEIAESLSQKSLDLAHTLNDRAAEAKILWNLLNIYLRTNREDEAIAAGMRSYELAESLNLKEQMAYSAIDMVKVYLFLGQGARLMSYGWRAVELWRELDNRPMLVDALTTQAFMLLGIGQLDQALTLSEEAKIISQESKNLWGEALSYYAPAMFHTERLNIEAGLAAFKAGLSLAEEGGVTIVQYYMNMFQTNLYLAISDYQNAKKCAERMLSIAGKQLPYHIKRATGTLALVYLEMGDMANAEELVHKLNYDIDNFELNFFLMIEKAMGKYLLEKEAYLDLLRLTTKVLESLEENNLVALMADFYYLHAHALLGLQQSDEAKNTLHKGLKIFQEIGGRRGILKLAVPLLKLEEQAGNETAVKQLSTEIEIIREHLKKQNIPSNI
jgi:tetratricopeptide (TPR) repeat protein